MEIHQAEVAFFRLLLGDVRIEMPPKLYRFHSTYKAEVRASSFLTSDLLDRKEASAMNCPGCSKHYGKTIKMRVAQKGFFSVTYRCPLCGQQIHINRLLTLWRKL